MWKIAILQISVAIIGFTSADVMPNCTNKFPTLKMFEKCCLQLKKMHLYDIAYYKCLTKYKDLPKPEYCAARCALDETGMRNPDESVNLDALNEFLVDQIKDPGLDEHMMNIITKCDTDVKEMLKDPRYNTDASQPCSQHALLVHQCVNSRGIINCPVQKWKRNDSECDQILKDALLCPF